MNLELKESDETKEDKDYYFMDTAYIGQVYMYVVLKAATRTAQLYTVYIIFCNHNNFSHAMPSW